MIDYIYMVQRDILNLIEFNEEGELTYTLCVDEKEEIKTVNVLQNYRLEVEQLGRCITDKEQPHISEEFSSMNARTLDRVLSAIGYAI